jgi:hypothetical protein
MPIHRNADEYTTYTVEVFKADKRNKSGERVVLKTDYVSYNRTDLKHLVETTWLAKDGYRFEIHETYVTRKNLLTGQEFRERYDTPFYCSPSSESFWSM